jgi:rRNA maturation endonuclease Nob1
MTKDEALKMAIELMERLLDFDGISSSDYIDVRDACKEALEQPAQDYVLICKRCGDDIGIVMDDM